MKVLFERTLRLSCLHYIRTDYTYLYGTLFYKGYREHISMDKLPTYQEHRKGHLLYPQ